MTKRTHILVAGLVLLAAVGCRPKAAELTVQEQITRDHAAIQPQLEEISAELYAGTAAETDSARYAELQKKDDSLQALLFDRYPAAELRRWASTHADLLGRQYESFQAEVEAKSAHCRPIGCDGRRE